MISKNTSPSLSSHVHLSIPLFEFPQACFDPQWAHETLRASSYCHAGIIMSEDLDEERCSEMLLIADPCASERFACSFPTNVEKTLD